MDNQMKRCNHCKTMKPISSEYFRRSHSSKDGFHWWCIECLAVADKARYNRNKCPEFMTLIAYRNAKRRCENKNDAAFMNYGGRGIKFKFSSFDEFKKHLGIRPDGLTLDRIDSNSHYEIGNVRWASVTCQNRNKRNVKLNFEKVQEILKLVSSGVSRRALSKIYNVSEGAISMAVNRKTWNDEKLSRGQ